MWTPVTYDDEWKAEVLQLLRQIASASAPAPKKYTCEKCGLGFDDHLAKARHVKADHKGESK